MCSDAVNPRYWRGNLAVLQAAAAAEAAEEAAEEAANPSPEHAVNQVEPCRRIFRDLFFPPAPSPAANVAARPPLHQNVPVLHYLRCCTRCVAAIAIAHSPVSMCACCQLLQSLSRQQRLQSLSTQQPLKHPTAASAPNSFLTANSLPVVRAQHCSCFWPSTLKCHPHCVVTKYWKWAHFD